jgi:hypothetical protein
MRNKITIFFAFTLILLLGSHETTSFFGFLEPYAIERSEEVPTREVEEHGLISASKSARPLVLSPGSRNDLAVFYSTIFRKTARIHSSFFKSSLHILFLSLRH